jgi:hypothetical protein
MSVPKARNNTWLIIIGIVSCICLACGGLLVIGSLLPPVNSTPTPTITLLAESIITQPTDIVFTSTSYILPTLTKPATAPPLETASPTATVIFILPTNAPSGSLPGICSCSGDNLNCSDFSDHDSAQACFDYCMAQGAEDINMLDENNNNDACEGLP